MVNVQYLRLCVDQKVRHLFLAICHDDFEQSGELEKLKGVQRAQTRMTRTASTVANENTPTLTT
jgi:hypothetical protein